jgi:predicted transcriptional regulator
MDIIGQILEAVDRNSGLSKPQIMHRAYLSFMQATDYLSLLADRSLVEYDKNMQTYSITEKGQHFLKKYNQIGEVIGKMQIRI